MTTPCAPTVAANAPLVEVMVTHLIDVTRDIFSTMIGRDVEFADPSYRGPQPTANVVSTVGFAGSLSGHVSLCLSQQAAMEIAQALLGCEPEEASEQFRDAAGEMANMIAGSLRTVMLERGETLGISTPIVTVGTDFSISSLRSVSQAVCPFTMGPQHLFVHLVLQGNAK